MIVHQHVTNHEVHDWFLIFRGHFQSANCQLNKSTTGIVLNFAEVEHVVVNITCFLTWTKPTGLFYAVLQYSTSTKRCLIVDCVWGLGWVFCRLVNMVVCGYPLLFQLPSVHKYLCKDEDNNYFCNICIQLLFIMVISAATSAAPLLWW